MAEAVDLPDNPNDITKLVDRIGNATLDEYKYAALTTADLRQQTILEENQRLSDYLVDRLALDRSIQQEAFASLADSLPPPVDTDVARKLQHPLLAETEELGLRKRALGDKTAPDVLSELREYSSVREFADAVLDAAGVWKTDEDESFDPGRLKGDFETTEAVLDQTPVILRLGEKQHFALRVPRKSSGGTMSGLIDIIAGPNVGEFIVVADEDRNNELTSLLLKSPNLLKYYMAMTIGDVQKKKKEQVDNEIRKAGLQKYEEVNKENEALNDPIRIRAFELLLKDANTAGEIEVISIIRDRHDVATLRGESPPKLDRVGTESSVTHYKVRPEGDMLIFNWRDKFGQSDEYEAKVRLTNGELEYGAKDDEGNFVWMSGEKSRYDAAPIHYNFFATIRVMTIDQSLKTGNLGINEAQRVSKELLGAGSSVELFGKFAELGISGYPTQETIVNLNPKVRYDIGVFPAELSLERAKSN